MSITTSFKKFVHCDSGNLQAAKSVINKVTSVVVKTSNNKTKTSSFETKTNTKTSK